MFTAFMVPKYGTEANIFHNLTKIKTDSAVNGTEANISHNLTKIETDSAVSTLTLTLKVYINIAC